MTFYEQLVSRNNGYIPELTQKRLSQVKLLIAGCGIGSQVAVAAARMGVQNFTLIDGDTVSATNLNRQEFFFDQIEKFKASALKDNILRVNPQAKVNAVTHHFDGKSRGLVEEVDYVIDTMDFLSLPAIIEIHELCEGLGKPLISGMSAGWGACAMYFSNSEEKKGQFRKLFAIPDGPTGVEMSYVQQFALLFDRLQPVIDPQVRTVMQTVFQKMADNQLCPAPQVVSGAYTLAAVILAILERSISGAAVPECPLLISLEMNRIVQSSTIKL